ncbi:MAG TPA: conjugative transposon protein TraM, partial [Cyclobacteriaceae bacterium]|nr:conjugative transposon protein TraM [Cyclobacteriaceae bacterium]
DPGKQEVKADPITKEKAYRLEENKTAENNHKIQVELNKKPVPLTAGISKVLEDPVEKKLEEEKSRTDHQYEETSEKNPYSNKGEEKAVVKKKPLPVYRASLAQTNEKRTEIAHVEKAKAEDPFNFTSYKEEIKEPIDSVPSNIKKSDSEIIRASVYGGQKVKAGGILKFRLMEEAIINKVTYPRNTIFYGHVSLGQDRLYSNVSRLPKSGGGFYKTNLIMHETDLQEGVYAPVNLTKDASSQQMANSAGNLFNSLSPIGQVGSAASSVFRTATAGPQSVDVEDGKSVYFLVVKK